MRVLINALGADMGGAVRHLRGFLPALSRAASDFQYVVLLRSSLPPLVDSSERVLIERVPREVAASWMRRVYYENVDLPKRLRREGFDAVVSLTNFGPLFPGRPHMLFQRNAAFFCGPSDIAIPWRRRLDRSLRRLFALTCMRKASINVTPSRAMADLIRSDCPSLRNRRFEVLHHAREAVGSNAPNDDLLRKLQQGRGARLVYPTHAAPHKGFPHLFEYLAAAKKDGLSFTLFTMLDHSDDEWLVRRLTARIDQLGLADNIISLGGVPQDQMAIVYENADVMVYPSLCESFGFSMVEAMTAGLPIVAVNTAINREMCEDAALYYDAKDVTGAVRALAEALRPARNQELRAKARERAKIFPGTWPEYVASFEGLLTALLRQDQEGDRMIRQAVKDVYFMVARWATLPNYQFARVRYRIRRPPQGLLVHLGSGDDYIAGMINVDGNIRRKKELWLDLRNPLPFPSRSAALVYCSHMLEHLYPEEALSLLREIRRIVAPDGVARIAVPSFEHALKIASQEATSGWPRPFDDPLGQAINFIFCDGQHKYGYSWGVLESFARKAGFEDIRRLTPSDPTRVGAINLGNEPVGSLVVELRDPGVQ